MKTITKIISILTIGIFMTINAASANANTVILVNGAWADATGSWQKLIPLLQAKGLKVVTALNPDTSLKEGAAAVTRAINNQTDNVILVGHSWGGAVITEAGNHEKVEGLVYLAGFAPDSGQSVTDLVSRFPMAPAFAELTVDSEGFFSMSEKGIAENFAQDLSAAEIKLMTATQLPIAGRTLEDEITEAAWKHKACWYVIPSEDRTIQPELRKVMAQNMYAVTTTIKSSHVVMLSHPEKVADIIYEAATSLKAAKPEVQLSH